MIGELNNNAPQLQQNALNSLQQEQNNKIQDKKAQQSQKADIQPSEDTLSSSSNNEQALVQSPANPNQVSQPTGPRGSVVDITV
jgi:hypothetical protein